MSLQLYNQLVTDFLREDPAREQRLETFTGPIQLGHNIHLILESLKNRQLYRIFGKDRNPKCAQLANLLSAEILNGSLYRHLDKKTYYYLLQILVAASDDALIERHLEHCYDGGTGLLQGNKPFLHTVLGSLAGMLNPNNKALDEFYGSYLNAIVKYKAHLRQVTLVPDKPGKIRIAVCISGQLRGYQDALKTWQYLNFGDECQVDYYLHTWDTVGRRFPNIIHANRTFDEPFLTPYLGALETYGEKTIMELYPSLFKMTNDTEYVTPQQLAQTYDIPMSHLLVEDEKAAKFAKFSNQDKMLYGFEKVYELAMASGQSYDLMMRIRPDLGFRPNTKKVRWSAVAEQLAKGRFILANGGNRIGMNGIEIGDQFALGRPELMHHYFMTCSQLKGMPATLFTREYGFSMLGHNLLRHAIYAKGVKSARLTGGNKIEVGSIYNPPKVDKASILEALEQDFQNRPKKEHECDRYITQHLKSIN